MRAQEVDDRLRICPGLKRPSTVTNRPKGTEIQVHFLAGIVTQGAVHEEDDEHCVKRGKVILARRHRPHSLFFTQQTSPTPHENNAKRIKKYTATWIRWWSPSQLLIGRSGA